MTTQHHPTPAKTACPPKHKPVKHQHHKPVKHEHHKPPVKHHPKPTPSHTHHPKPSKTPCPTHTPPPSSTPHPRPSAPPPSCGFGHQQSVCPPSCGFVHSGQQHCTTHHPKPTPTITHTQIRTVVVIKAAPSSTPTPSNPPAAHLVPVAQSSSIAPPAQPVLASTGAEYAAPLGIALALLLAGSVLILTASRKRIAARIGRRH